MLLHAPVYYVMFSCDKDTHTNTHKHTHTLTHIHTHTHTHTLTHTHTHSDTHTHTHSDTHTHTHTHTHWHPYTHTHTHTHTHTKREERERETETERERVEFHVCWPGQGAQVTDFKTARATRISGRARALPGIFLDARAPGSLVMRNRFLRRFRSGLRTFKNRLPVS